MNSGSEKTTQMAVLTPPGRGAVAVVALQGKGATLAVEQYFHAANGRPLERQPLSRIVFGRWGDEQGEELIVCRRSAEQIEVHCHGGPQAAKQIVEQLSRAGCELVDWQQWLAGACRIATEAQLALAQAQTSRAAAILLDQYHGALRDQVAAIRTQAAAGSTDVVREQLAQLLARSPVGLHLTDPWQVVIAGQPNVGKSSILNALAGYRRAIVFDQPGTTRDVISTDTALDGWPVRLSDTAGLHATTDPIEQAGIDWARDQLAYADLVVWVVDCAQWSNAGCSQPTELVAAELAACNLIIDLPQLLVVGNKVDLCPPAVEPADTLPLLTSALTGRGIEELVQGIAGRLVPQAPPPGCAVPFTQRQTALLQTALQQCETDDLTAAAVALDELLTDGD